MKPLHPCVCCGEPTRCFLHLETAEGSPGGVSFCAECISIWQLNKQARQLLLASSGCSEGATIRRLLRPVRSQAPEERPAAAELGARLASGRPRDRKLL